MHFLIVIYTACKILAKWWWFFLGTSHVDLEGWQKCPPAGFCGRGTYPPPGITHIFTNSHICQFLMDSKDLCICKSAMIHTI